MEVKRKAPRRIAQAVLNSLKGGVVPRIGLPYVTVGRKHEIDALLHDIEIIGEGGASFRFIMGRYGSGKSFLMQLIRGYALERNFLTADCDLSPERRLYGTSGTGVGVRLCSHRTSPMVGTICPNTQEALPLSLMVTVGFRVPSALM